MSKKLRMLQHFPEITCRLSPMLKKLHVFQHLSAIVADFEDDGRFLTIFSKISLMLQKMHVIQHFPKVLADVEEDVRVFVF